MQVVEHAVFRVEVHAAQPARAAEGGARVQHAVVVVEEQLAGRDREATLMAWVADDAREAIIGAVVIASMRSNGIANGSTVK